MASSDFSPFSRDAALAQQVAESQASVRAADAARFRESCDMVGRSMAQTAAGRLALMQSGAEFVARMRAEDAQRAAQQRAEEAVAYWQRRFEAERYSRHEWQARSIVANRMLAKQLGISKDEVIAKLDVSRESAEYAPLIEKLTASMDKKLDDWVDGKS